MSKKTLLSINFHFLQRNQSKLPKDFLEVSTQSKRFVYVCEGGSVCSSPPDLGLTGEFCVCIRQNVAKQHNFSRIFDILSFCRHFADMLMTCTTKLQILPIMSVSVTQVFYLVIDCGKMFNPKSGDTICNRNRVLCSHLMYTRYVLYVFGSEKEERFFYLIL